MAYYLRGGPVEVPSWILIFRMGQFFFAILALGLTGYSLSFNGGGPMQRPLIATITISALTIILILPLTTPIFLVQRKIFDPRVSLLLDFVALLFWLASLSALSSYQDLFSDYGKGEDNALLECVDCRQSWRTGAASSVFAGIEFLFFLITTLTFTYYYHCELAGVHAAGISRSGRNSIFGAPTDMGETATAGGARAIETGDNDGQGAENMSEISKGHDAVALGAFSDANRASYGGRNSEVSATSGTYSGGNRASYGGRNSEVSATSGAHAGGSRASHGGRNSEASARGPSYQTVDPWSHTQGEYGGTGGYGNAI